MTMTAYQFATTGETETYAPVTFTTLDQGKVLCCCLCEVVLVTDAQPATHLFTLIFLCVCVSASVHACSNV